MHSGAAAALAAVLALTATSAASTEALATLRDCSDCPELVAIPAGRFTMGVAPGEEDRESLAEEFRHRSEPARSVEVRGFLAGRFEVTRAQYRVFAQASGRGGEGCFVWSDARFEFHSDKDWRNPGYAQDDSHPVVCVSWDDATAYVRWLGARTGKRYRLLTEAEWEYAARAGTSTSRYWGDDPHRACAFANGADRAAAARVPDIVGLAVAACDDGHVYTAPVGRFQPNAFGLYDMLGNAWEWTQDCWNDNYAGAHPDARAATTGECALRSVRGGSWDDTPTALRAAYRVGSPTTVRVYGRGFRVARDPD